MESGMAEQNKAAAQAEHDKQEEMYRNMPTLALDTDDGRTIQLRVFDELDSDGKHYLAVFEDDSDEIPEDQRGQLVLLQVIETPEGKAYDVVEDDETLLRLGKIVDKHIDAFYASDAE